MVRHLHRVARMTAAVALLGVVCIQTVAAAELPASREGLLAGMAEVTVDNPKRADGSHLPVIDGGLLVWPWDGTTPPPDVKQALATYQVVSEQEWSQPAAHMAVTSRGWTGLLVMKDGRTLRWVMPYDGQLCLRYPDGRWLYLLSEALTRKPHQALPWQPTDRRSARLFSPTEPDTCQASAQNRQEAVACFASLLQGSRQQSADKQHAGSTAVGTKP